MSNTLVPVRPINRDSETPHVTPQATSRPDAGFLAHLIATSAQAPQTRARRRAEPDEAVSAYCGVGQRPGAVGRVLSRSL